MGFSDHRQSDLAARAGDERESDQCSCGVTLESPFGQAYNEEAFRHFLMLEWKRSALSGRPFLLLLAHLSEPPGGRAPLPPVVAARLFAGLWRCLRETDFIGWYREGSVTGAVLTELVDGNGTDVSDLVAQRVGAALDRSLPSEALGRLRVRIYRLPARGHKERSRHE